ncbi:unnamed protein product [Agarophyton chilense]
MAHYAPDAAESLDMLADVSHHGASFFELFAADRDPAHRAVNLDPTALPNPEPAAVSALPPLLSHHHLSVSSAFSHPPLSAPPSVTHVSLAHVSPPPASIARKRRAPSSAPPPATSTKRRKPRSASSASLSVKLEEETEASDASVPPTSSQPLSSPVPHRPHFSNHDSGAINPLLKDTHNSHTRKCRAKVNSKFQELLSILPPPPSNTGIKHKAQILDYTIRVFRDIHARKTLLEAELALSSRVQLSAWVNSIVSRSLSIQDALAPYLSLICAKGTWKYSEAWVPKLEPTPSNTNSQQLHAVTGESQVLTASNMLLGPDTQLRLGLAVIPSLGNTDDPDLIPKLERFRDRSRPYTCKARVDLPGRIMCTMRPEWLPSLEDHEAFQRSKLARDASLVVCFGVPVFIRGHVAAVAVFFDTDQRTFDAKCVDLAVEVADLLGNTYGASAMKRVNFR